jgi:hypothetical protein
LQHEGELAHGRLHDQPEQAQADHQRPAARARTMRKKLARSL